jgi:hypothetical protein
MNSSKINFIHIAKNAGTSFRELCKTHKDFFIYNGHSVDVFNPNIKNQLIIIQNPVSRFKSSVRYTFSEKWAKEPQIEYLNKNNINTPDKWVTILKDNTNPEYSNLMQEMLNRETHKIHYIGSKKIKYKYTYTPQKNYVNDPAYVILMENIEDETNLLLKNLGIDFKIKKLNSTKKTDCNDYISDENIEWLTNVFYKEDNEIYNKYKKIPVEIRLKL